MSFQIAIDGPAGAGKSTVAKQVAKQVHAVYVDTGAMYRAMGLYLDSLGIDLSSEAEIGAHCGDARITLECTEEGQKIYLDGKDVTTAVREERAGMLASKTSAFPPVRIKLSALQKEIAQRQDVVMDGRDIGTAVLPDAQLKIYLTASVETRANRRYLELIGKGQPADKDAIAADIRQRDDQDMHRAMSPLCQAEDAVYVDSSEMTIGEVVERIVKLAAERRER